MNEKLLTPLHPAPQPEIAPARPAPFGLLPDQSAVLINAHPDDEFMHGAAAFVLAKQGYRVSAVVLTDGEASTRGEPAFVRSGKRRSESAAALGELGITAKNQHYFGFADGYLRRPDVFEKASLQLADYILDQKPAALITTGTQGFGHADHTAAHGIAVAAASIVSRLKPAVEPVVWGLSERPGEETFIVPPTVKFAALRHHASQFTLKAAGVHPPEPGWARHSGYDITEAHMQLLTPYRHLLDVESYNRHNPINHGSLYDILLANEAV